MASMILGPVLDPQQVIALGSSYEPLRTCSAGCLDLLYDDCRKPRERTGTMGEFIMVPVPADRVLDVYDLLAITIRSAAASTGDTGNAHLSPDWTENDIKVCYSESSDEMKHFLRLLAAQPDDSLRSDELYPQLGYTAHQFAGAMGALGRRVRNRYGKSTWFFTVSEDPESELALYRMEANNALIINLEATKD